MKQISKKMGFPLKPGVKDTIIKLRERLLFFTCMAVLLLSSVETASSQDLKRRLVSSPTESGLLEFVKEFEDAGFGKVESVRIIKPGCDIYLLLVGSFLFGYYQENKMWRMFLDDNIDSASLNIDFGGKKICYRRAADAKDVEVPIVSISQLYKH